MSASRGRLYLSDVVMVMAGRRFQVLHANKKTPDYLAGVPRCAHHVSLFELPRRHLCCHVSDGMVDQRGVLGLRAKHTRTLHRGRCLVLRCWKGIGASAAVAVGQRVSTVGKFPCFTHVASRDGWRHVVSRAWLEGVGRTLV